MSVPAVLLLLVPMASSAFTGYLWGYDRGEGKGFWRGLEAGRREADFLGGERDA